MRRVLIGSSRDFHRIRLDTIPGTGPLLRLGCAGPLKQINGFEDASHRTL